MNYYLLLYNTLVYTLGTRPGEKVYLCLIEFVYRFAILVFYAIYINHFLSRHSLVFSLFVCKLVNNNIELWVVGHLLRGQLLYYIKYVSPIGIF